MIEINKIYNESNCDTMSRMPDNYIDLTVTSPPYDNLRSYEGYEWDFERVAQGLYRVTKPGGIVVWVVSDATINGSEQLSSSKQKIYFREKCGFNIHDTMIYKKQNPLPINNNRYNPCFEYCFILSKGKPTTFNPLMEKKVWEEARTVKNYSKDVNGVKNYGKVSKSDYKLKNNIFEYKVGGGHVTKDEIAYEHPAIFPEALAKDHILSWSNEREIIYDPFMGSGTVAKMCILTNRNYIGSEISLKYCGIAERRLKPYKQQPDMFYEVSKKTV